jgi:hypothetical protein
MRTLGIVRVHELRQADQKAVGTPRLRPPGTAIRAVNRGLQQRANIAQMQ